MKCDRWGSRLRTRSPPTAHALRRLTGRNRPQSDLQASCDPGQESREAPNRDARSRMIAGRRAQKARCRAEKPAVATEHQHLRCGLVHDRERIALIVLGCDNPAGEFNHRAGHFLVWRKPIDSGYGLRDDILGVGHVEVRKRQRHYQCAMDGPDCRGSVHTDRTIPWNEDCISKGNQWPVTATCPGFRRSSRTCARTISRTAGGGVRFQAAGRDLQSDPAVGWPIAPTDWRIQHFRASIGS